MQNIQLVSIAIEAIIVIVSLVLLFKKKNWVGLGFAITFGFYVFYDLSGFYAWQLSANLLTTLFLVASVSALASIITIYRKTEIKQPSL